uniref:Disintegrin and metalloproteinase domain-containing protein 9-like n=1 Tax=Echeneis naucrates TaxID=173247 RepID=A0A665WSK0_ECHNA
SVVNPELVYRRIRSVNKLPQSEQVVWRLLKLKLFNVVALPVSQVHCYYHGTVDGYEDSLVALSTCSGLRGLIIFGNETYGLEPVPQSATNEHLLYLLKDIQSEPVTCGVVHETSSGQNHEPFEPGHSLTSLLRMKRNLPQTSYVELVLVADNLRYNFRNRNETAVREELVEIANILDGYYKQLNIRVVLVGLEIFKDGNPFSVEGSAGDVLGTFVQWRKKTLLPKTRHDIGQLLVGRPTPYNGGVLGMAFVGSVCSVATSGGINVFSNDDLIRVSAIVAHEMGHNLGMSHDNGRCSCEGGPCVMAATVSGSTTFSSCSAMDFENLILRGGGMCLKNQPSPSDVVSSSKCGNGRLEKGEQCDCGTPEECDNKCCDAATCRLTRGAACAQGECCVNCQITVSGTPCRESVNTCDLPEYCDGERAFCPDDYYMMDGLPCQSNTAYCFEGRCQTYDFQCKHLFASDEATKASDICFQHANIQGDAFGNCGITNSGFIKCAVANAMCGKVQCANVDVNKPPSGAKVSIQIVQGSRCINADFNLGTDVLDPAYVNTGSPCSQGKACLNFQCVNASTLLPDLNCDAQRTCNGRGVCNDQGNCHCDNGWAPPNCDKAGRGGSINSGPAQIDYSLRNGLLIFFLLVVPLLVVVILALLYVFKRDTLNVCLKRKRNSRYGEVNDWNTATSTIPAPHQPPPRQGPGVPRPIPPKQPLN